MTYPATTATFEPDFADATIRAAAAEVWNTTYVRLLEQGVSPEDAAATARNAALRRGGQLAGTIPPDPPREERVPTPGAMEADEYAAIDGATVELRAGGDERIMFRGVERVVSRGQVLVIARTEHKGDDAITVSPTDLEQAARNATAWPLIPIDFDHLSGHGGEAGGVVIPESVRVGTDPKTKLPALIGDIAYNLDVAADVRGGRWLGGSVRLLRGVTDKRSGERIGTVLGAWSLTNVPQQDDIEVSVNFSAARIGTPRNDTVVSTLDTRPDMGHISVAGTATDKDHSMAIDPAAQITELTTQHTARVAELTSQVAAAKTDADKARTELAAATAQIAELTASSTSAQERVTELASRMATIELDAKRARDTSAIELAFAGKTVGKALRDSLTDELRELSELSLTTSGEVGTKLRARYDAKLAQARTLQGTLQSEMKGKPGAEGESGGKIEWTTLVERVRSEKSLASAQAAKDFIFTAEGRENYPGAEQAFAEYMAR